VTFGDIAVPLPATSSGQIQAPVQDALPTGMQVVEVRSLSTAQDSDPVVMTVKPGNLGRTRSANLWQIVRVGLQHEWFGSYMGRQRNGQSVVCRWPNLTLDRPNEQV
jgi:hypothetical protein